MKGIKERKKSGANNEDKKKRYSLLNFNGPSLFCEECNWLCNKLCKGKKVKLSL
jgi:hypothetical protein